MCLTRTSAPPGPAATGTGKPHGFELVVLSIMKPGPSVGLSIHTCARTGAVGLNVKSPEISMFAATGLPRGIGEGNANCKVTFLPVPGGTEAVAVAIIGPVGRIAVSSIVMLAEIFNTVVAL